MAEPQITAARAEAMTPAIEQASHKWAVAISVMLGATLEILDGSIVNVSLPHMQGTFSASVDQIAWVLTSYLVAAGIMIPMTGWISSRFGRKRYFLASMTGFVIASVLCGAAQSLNQIVIFRVLQGLAGAAMIPSSQAILMETFPPNEQQMAMAVWGIGLQLAPIAGPTVGGWITDNLNWRWNFYINVPVGIVALIMASAFLHDPPYLRQQKKSGGRVDWPGMAFLVIGIGLLEIMVDRGQRSEWFAAPWVRYCTIASMLAMILLTIRELKFSAPIVDLRILAIRDFLIMVVLGTANIGALYIVSLVNPLFLQELMGYTAWRAGLLMVPRAFGTLAGMLIVGQLGRKNYDTRPYLGAGFVVIAAGFYYASKWDLQVDAWAVAWVTMIQGFGMGVVFPIMSSTALSCVSRDRMGFAASMYNMVRNIGASISLSVATDVLVSHEQVHQSRLGEHFSIFEAWRMGERAPRMPGAAAFHYLPQIITHQKQGLGEVYAVIQTQAAMLAFNDIYRILAFTMLLMAPWFIFLGRRRTPGAPAGH
ncbi:MAG: DHA2 family efflux MFS transporter permease subunit [Candidatus Binataceae bacterium]|nr:DHA2 family efflux MFS transporter permease subunit [Candidatus Binataceae bacterium]